MKRRLAHSIKENLGFLLIIFIIPVFISGLVLSFIMSQHSIENLDERIGNSTELISDNISSMMDNAANIIQYSENSALVLNRVMSNADIDYADSLSINQISAFLNSFVNTTDTLDSIYIYMDNPSGKMLSSSQGFIFKHRFLDAGALDLIPASPAAKQILTRSKVDLAFERPRMVLSYLYRFSAYDGGIVVNYNSAKIQNLLDSSKNYETQRFILCRSDGEILAHSSNLTPSENYFYFEGFNRYEFLTSVNIPLYGMVMYSYIPRSTAFSQMFLSLIPILVTIVVLIAMSILASILLARKTYKQVDQIANIFRMAHDGKPLPAIRQEKDDIYSVLINETIKVFLEKDYLTAKQRIAELQALQYQINPHFLYNALQVISYEVQSRNNGRRTIANSMLEDLSDIIRYSLGSDKQHVTIRDEIRNCTKYVEIQSVRYKAKINVVWDIPEELMDTKVQRLIFQPIIENSIIHGLRSRRQGLIKVHVSRHGDFLYTYIHDNGVGISEENLAGLRAKLETGSEVFSSEHIGLQNCNLRLSLEYGPDSRVKVYSRENKFTVVMFRIPLKDTSDPSQP